jgi:hypothetical protein
MFDIIDLVSIAAIVGSFAVMMYNIRSELKNSVELP